MAREEDRLEPRDCNRGGAGDAGLAARRFGVRRLVAIVHPDHIASRRVAESIGMRVETTTVLDDGYPAAVYVTRPA